MRLQLVAGWAILLACTAARAGDDPVDTGRYLLAAGGCIECHTADTEDAVPLAGGRALKTPFGTFYAPNITPDIDTGIGSWSDEDFLSALWDGVSPGGEHYYPAFPYSAYTGLSRDDVLAIKAYLFTLEPVRSATPDHELSWYVSTRLAAGAWKLAYFRAGRFVSLEQRSPAWNRGAYLVRHLGHCGECHTPRGALGGLDRARELAGHKNPVNGEWAPNITPHREYGIGRWTASDIEYFLDIGMLPDGDFVGGSMSRVIDINTSELTRDDRLAVATYLKSLPALASQE